MAPPPPSVSAPVAEIPTQKAAPIAAAPAPTRSTNTITERVVEKQTIIRQPVIERFETIQSASSNGVASVGGVTENILNQKIQELDKKLSSQIISLTSANSTAIAQNYIVTAQTNRIDQLSGTSITSPSINGGSITGAAISGGSISGTVINAGTLTLAAALSETSGGTGQSTFATGDMLYASGVSTLSKLATGSAGQVLKISGGVPTWGADASGSGGSGAFATTSDNLAVYPSDTGYVILLGTAATSTTGNILEVKGNSLFRNNLTAYGTITTPSFTATSTSIASLFGGGFVSQASSTVVGQFSSTRASTTQFTNSGSTWFTGLSSALLATDQNGKLVSTTSISTGLLVGSLGTINGTTFNVGGAITVGAASSTLLSDNNTFSGNNIFSATLRLTTGYVSQASSTVVGAFTTTGTNTFNGASNLIGLGTLTAGFVSQASSTVVGLFSSTQASTTMLTNTGNTYLTNITNSILSTNAAGLVVATTSIGTNYLTGTLATINSTAITAGGTFTITAASSTLLANNNTWTGLQNFANSSSTLTTLGTTWFSGISNGVLSTNAAGLVVATTSIGTNYLTGSLGTINGTTFSVGGAITVGAASTTLLSDHNTFAGNNIFSSPLSLSSTSGTTTIASGQGFTIGGSQFVLQQGSGRVGIGTASPSAKLSISDSGFNVNVSSALGLQVNTTGTGGWTNLGTANTGPILEWYSASNTGLGVISATGKFGIGITTPKSQVQIATSSAPTTITAANSYLTIGGTEFGTNSYRLISFGYQGPTDTYSPAYMGYQETNINGETLGDLIFGTRAVITDTQATERMRITSAGFVGIGTTSPTNKLEVQGGAFFGGNVIATGTLTAVNGLALFANATTTYATISGSTWLTGITASSLLALDANNKIIATTSIGTGLLSGTLATINSTAITAGGTFTITAASSTLLSDHNTFSGNNIFSANLRLTNGYVSQASSTVAGLFSATQASTTMFTNAGNTYFTGITNSILSTNAAGLVVATTSIGTNYLTGTLGTINGTTFSVGGSITVGAASTTLLSNNNTWSGLNVFANSTSTLGTITTGWSTNWNATYASSTAISATTICLTGDTCRTSWPSAGSGAWPFTPSSYAGVANQSTTTPLWLNGTQLIASSTLVVNATTTGSAYFAGNGVWNSSGNVGIGTTSPYSTLSITGTAGTNPFVIASSTGSAMLSLNQRGILTLGATTNANIFINGGATSSNPALGLRNVALGNQAFSYYTTDADDNIAIGYQALYGSSTVLMTGYNNSALGYLSLYSNTEGYDNNALGYQSLKSNTTGYENNALGYNALRDNTTGFDNNALGNQSLESNTTGFDNNALGDWSLHSNTTGTSNNALGASALESNTTGSFNTAIGYQAGYNITTGYDNIFLGHTQNTGGNAITTGGGNIGLGYNIVYPSVSQNRMINLGNSIFGTLVATSTSTSLPTTMTGIAFGIATSSLTGNTFSVQNAINTNNVASFFSSTGAPLLTLTNSGLLGIGTTTPGSLLSLNGIANFHTATSTFYSTGGINLAGGCFSINGTCVGGGAGSVSSVANSDGTLTISPTTGSVVASLNLGNSNWWTGAQKFTNATTSQFTATSSVWFTSITNALLSTGNDGKLTATTTPTASYFIATSNTASTFPYASTTALTATTLCLTGDSCRTTWPSAGGSGAWPFTPYSYAGVANQSTTTPLWLNGTQLIASSTLVVNATTTGSQYFSALTSALLSTDAAGKLVATTSIGTNLLTGSLGTVNGTTFNAGGAITISAASTTLLSDANTFAGSNIFSSTLRLTNGFVSQASSTIVGAGTIIGATALGSTLAVTGASTFTGLGTFTNGYVSQASSTVVGLFSSTQASTSLLTNTGNTYLSSITSGLLGTDATGKVVATSSIGTNLLTGALATINGTSVTAGGSFTITAASSTLLANNNSWTGLQNFANASSTLATLGTTWFSGISNSILSTDQNGKVIATSSIGTNLLTGSLGTINGTTFNAGSSITIGAASTTLLSDNNTFSGNNIFSATLRLTNGFVSQASSTVTGNFTTTGTNFFNGASNLIGLGTLTAGFVSQASSTVVGLFSSTQASTTLFTNSGNTYLTSITNGLLGTDATGKVVATTTIGINYLSANTIALATGSTGSDINVSGSPALLGGTLTLNIPSASSGARGLLTSGDWSIFNNKISSSSLSASFPLAYSSSSGAFSYLGLGTSSAPTTGQLSYWTGANTLGTVATTSVTCSGNVSCTTFNVLGASPITITATAAAWPFSPSSYAGVANQATTTNFWLNGAQLIASSTLVVNATTTGSQYFTGLTNALLSTDSTGKLVATTSIGTNLLTGTLGVGNGGTGSTTLSGILKGNGTGSILSAVGGTDYEFPLSFSYPFLRTTNTISLAFGTTTNNTWAGTQTFTGAPVLSSLVNSLLWVNGTGTIAATSTPTAAYFIATSTLQASMFPYASSTALSATTLCLTGDTCRSTWPAGGSSAWPFTPSSYNGVANQSTTTPLWLNGTQIIASSTFFTNASTTIFSNSGSAWFTGLTSSLLSTDANGRLSATTSIGTSLLTGILGIGKGGTNASTQITSGVNYFDGSKITSDSQFNFNGTQVGIGTTTPFWNLTVASSTGPQLALLDTTSTSNAWTLRSINDNFYIATSTAMATSSVSALSINSSGLLTVTSATTTNFFGSGLATCNSGNVLTWSDGRFGCAADQTGLGGSGAWPFTTGLSNFGVSVQSTTTPLWLKAGLFASSTTAYPTFAVEQSGAGPAATFVGNVGISTSTPWGRLSIGMGTNPAFVVTNAASSSPSFYIGGVNQNGFVGLGTTTSPSLARLVMDNFVSGTGVASAIAGIHQIFTFNPTAGGTQVGDRTVIQNTPTGVVNTAVAKIVRIIDSSALSNLVRGFDITASGGTNTFGVNTGLRATGHTFGIQGLTTGLAGGTSTPAALYGENTGTTQGDILRLYTSTMTSAAQMAQFYHEVSSFTGTGLLMNFGAGGGAFTGNFLDLQVNGNSRFKISAGGTTTIGQLNQTSIQAGLQIGYGGLCVDNDGACVASTTGRISAVSYTTGATDLAENYYSSESLESGDIVRTSGKYSVARAAISSDPIIGVVSTKPGVILGENETHVASGTPYAIGLAGRIPIKISTENGNVTVGDSIVLSSVSGVGMKASGTKDEVVVGIALEAFDGSVYRSEATIENEATLIATGTPVCTTQESASNPKSAGGSDIEGESAGKSASALKVFEEVCSQKKVLVSPSAGEAQSVTVSGKQVKIGKVLLFIKLQRSMFVGNLILSTSTATSTENSSYLSGYIVDALKRFGIFLSEGLVRIKNLVVDTFTVGSPENPAGITLYDEDTGKAYCLKVKGGNMVHTKGECGSPVADTHPVSPPADETPTSLPIETEIPSDPPPSPEASPSTEGSGGAQPEGQASDPSPSPEIPVEETATPIESPPSPDSSPPPEPTPVPETPAPDTTPAPESTTEI